MRKRKKILRRVKECEKKEKKETLLAIQIAYNVSFIILEIEKPETNG